MLELFWYVVRIRMKRLLVGLMAVGLMAQVPSVLFEREPPPRVPTNRISAQVTGVGGTQTYFYWVVATYPVGDAFPGGPVRVNDVADTLAGGNFVTVRWPLMPGALSYDVLRTTTAQYPSGAANVLVAGAVAGPAQADIANAVGAYTLASTSRADGFLRLNNQRYAQPEFVIQPGLNVTGDLDVTGTITGGGVSSFTQGSILFAGALGQITEDNANLFWDNINMRLGIGTNVPASRTEIHGLTDAAETYLSLIRFSGANVITMYSVGAGTSLISGDSLFRIETDSVTGTLALGNVNGRDRIYIVDTTVGIGPLNAAPTGTADFLDRTPVTGETKVKVGYDGTNTSVLTTLLSVTAGQTQGATDLQTWQDNDGIEIASVNKIVDVSPV